MFCRASRGPRAVLSPAPVSRRGRRGATLVETAVALPVFFTFMFALFEFGHAYMIQNTLNAAAKRAARYGIADDVTTAQVKKKVEDILRPAMNISRATIYIKNAGTFDTATTPTNINYSALPAIELKDAEPRQLFLVRVEVPYRDVAIIPPFWIKNVTLKGQSVIRHE